MNAKNAVIALKWLGKCPSCNAWDTFSEMLSEAKSSHKAKLNTIAVANIVKLKDIQTDNNYRMISGIEELDRVLGGGIVPGSLILVEGDRESEINFDG